MPNIRQVWQLTQHGNVAFSFDLKDAYIFLLLSLTIGFYSLFGKTNIINGMFHLLGWLWPLGFSSHSLNPYFFFAIARVCMLLKIGRYLGSYMFQVCWQKSLSFILLSFGSSWITYYFSHILLMLCHIIGPFIFRVLVPTYFCGTWYYSTRKVHTAFGRNPGCFTDAV